MNPSVVRAGVWATLFSALLAVAIVLGSRNLAHFDAALVGYTFATLFATFGITYRYAMWLQRPPTRMYWRRGWQVFFAAAAARRQPRCGFAQRAVVEVARQSLHLPPRRAARARALADHVGLPPRRRDHVPARLRLDSLRDRARRPRHATAPIVFGFPAGDFPVDSVARRSSSSTAWSGRRSWCIAGVMLAFRRRMRDHGAAAVQQFGEDILPLVLLVRDQRHRADAHGQLHVDAGLRVRLPRDPPRGHGDRHAALAAVRQVLPHLPAAGAARRRLLQGRGRARRAGALPALRAAVRVRR